MATQALSETGLFPAFGSTVLRANFRPISDTGLWPTGPAIVPDTTPPVVGNFAPALGTTLAANQPISFDVTDDSGAFRRVIVHAVFANGIEEVVHNGDSFRGLYQTSSSRVIKAGGFTYTILRTGGWPSSPASFNVFALDESGNEAA